MGQQYSHLSSEERILIEKLHCERHLSVRKIELRRGLWFASNENGSYRPYRPKRLKTGAWTSGVLLQCLFDRFGSVFPQCGLMVFPGVVIVSR